MRKVFLIKKILKVATLRGHWKLPGKKSLSTHYHLLKYFFCPKLFCKDYRGILNSLINIVSKPGFSRIF